MSLKRRKSNDHRSIQKTTGCFGYCCSRKKQSIRKQEKVLKSRLSPQKLVPIDEQPVSQDACQWQSDVCACDLPIEDKPVDLQQNRTSTRVHEQTIKQMSFVNPSEYGVDETMNNLSSNHQQSDSELNKSSKSAIRIHWIHLVMSVLVVHALVTLSCHTVEIEYSNETFLKFQPVVHQSNP